MERRYTDWKKKVESLSYVFKEESEDLFQNNDMDEVFDCSQGHPIVLKKFLGGNISLETLVIYDRILGYGNNFDKKLKDPVWETVSRRVRKYTPFLNIDVFRYKKILKEVVISGTYNAEVLENLRKQIVEVNTQYEQLATTRLKLLGAIDVLEQISEC